MAPKQNHVFVVFVKTDDGVTIPYEAFTKEEDAKAAFATFEETVGKVITVTKVNFDVTLPKKSGKAKSKTTTTAKNGNGKAKSEETIINSDPLSGREDGAKEAPPPKSTKRKSTPKKSEPKQDESDADDARKQIPDGIQGALRGYNLLFTGTMDIDRGTVEATVNQYGGELVKKLEDADFIVLGTKPGPKKVEEIKAKGLKTMSEKQFYEMLKTGEEPDEDGPASKKAKV